MSPEQVDGAQAVPAISGMTTFLFTDVEDSTPLMQTFPAAMPGALTRQQALLEAAIKAHGGMVFQVVGDGMCAAFASATEALCAALDAQRTLANADWPDTGALRVRMGLNTGVAEAQAGSYRGYLTLARVQRVMTAAHGGQTLLTNATAELVREQLPAGTALRALGLYKLRGLTQPEALYQIVADDLPSEFAPLRDAEPAGESQSAAGIEQLTRGVLIGRQRENQQLAKHWALALAGQGQLVLLSGEPGIGKTRLAQELIGRALAGGATVLTGGCYEYEATTPYLPFVDAFQSWVHQQSAAALRGTLGATAPEIARLAPEISAKLGGLPPSEPLPTAEERLRLFDAVARFLQTLAARHGLLMFLDDLHWADQGTLSLLHYVLRHLHTDRILVVGAYREIELDRAHPLAATLIEWNRERLATRLPLGRLSETETGALLAALFKRESVSEDLTSALFRETEGNPFFLEEVVKTLVEQGQFYLADGRWERKAIAELTIPQSVREAIGRRLSRLHEPTIDVLRTAAALGKVFPFRELAAVAGGGAALTLNQEDELLNALDEATASQLLRAGGDDTFAFTHDKIREVLYEELNPIRQRRLHQRIGESLIRLYGPEGNGHTQDLAYHFTHSGDAQRSLEYSLRAAQHAEALYAHEAALEQLAQARMSAEALGQQEQLTAIDERIGEIHTRRGEIPPAAEAYERALAGVTSRSRAAALKATLGEVYAPAGDPRGLAYLQQALEELDPQTQANELALATAVLGRYHHYRSDFAQAIAYLEKARALGEPLDNEFTLMTIYTYLAGAYQHLLQFDTSDAWARAAIALGERKQSLYPEALGYEFLAENSFGRSPDNSLRYSSRNIELGRKAGSLARVGWGSYALMQGHWGRGALAEAWTTGTQALEIAEQIGDARLVVLVESELGPIAADRGMLDAAEAHAQNAWRHAQPLDQPMLDGWALYAQGWVAAQRGDVVSAAAWYDRYVERVANSANRFARNLGMAYAAEGALRAGRMDKAAQRVEWALSLSEEAGMRIFYGIARRVQGQLLMAQGGLSAAQQALDSACAVLEETGARLEFARALYQRACLAKQGADLVRAIDDAERSRALCVEMGARVDQQGAEELQRTLAG